VYIWNFKADEICWVLERCCLISKLYLTVCRYWHATEKCHNIYPNVFSIMCPVAVCIYEDCKRHILCSYKHYVNTVLQMCNLVVRNKHFRYALFEENTGPHACRILSLICSCNYFTVLGLVVLIKICNIYRAKEVNCVFATAVMRSMCAFSLFVIIKGIYVHVNKVSEMNYLFKL